MKKILIAIFYGLILLPLAAWATPATPSFQAGKDYQVISGNVPTPTNQDGKIQVVEFFSYGCPACFAFEPTLENWLKTKPKNVDFDRVPVVFDPGWDVLARAYYTAKDLNALDKLTPAIFNALHVQGIDLTNQANLEAFFIKEGVSKQDFESAFNFSPRIDTQLMQADRLMRSLGVFQIPTLVVDNKYKTNIGMVNGDPNRLIKVVNYLITLEQKKANG